jgi:hypothetical protein
VNRLKIAAFNKKVATSIADALGTLITISGVSFYAHVTTPKPTMSLETGGFNTDKAVTIRYPVGRANVPALGTAVLLVAENLTFRVQTAITLLGSPLGAEVIITAIRE